MLRRKWLWPLIILLAAVPITAVYLIQSQDSASAIDGETSDCDWNPFLQLTDDDREWIHVEPDKKYRDLKGLVTDAKVSSTDNPYTHVDHDWLIFVDPDPWYEDLISENTTHEGWFNDTTSNGIPLMENEWEHIYVPDFAKPFPGDRIWMRGQWIWDCGHTVYRTTDGGEKRSWYTCWFVEGASLSFYDYCYEGYKTEIHPPHALATMRSEGAVLQENSPPVPATVARAYFSPFGGKANNPEDDIEDVVSNSTYEFQVPLPNKESLGCDPGQVEPLKRITLAEPHLIWDMPGGVLPQINTSWLPSIESPGSLMVKIKIPEIIPDIGGTPDTRKTTPYQFQIAVGWPNDALGKCARQVQRVRAGFNHLVVNYDYDLVGCGEWWMFAGINGNWHSLQDYEIGDTENSWKCEGGDIAYFPDSAAWDINIWDPVPENRKLVIHASGYEDDLTWDDGVSKLEFSAPVDAAITGLDPKTGLDPIIESEDGDYHLSYWVRERMLPDYDDKYCSGPDYLEPNNSIKDPTPLRGDLVSPYYKNLTFTQIAVDFFSPLDDETGLWGGWNQTDEDWYVLDGLTDYSEVEMDIRSTFGDPELPDGDQWLGWQIWDDFPQYDQEEGFKLSGGSFSTTSATVIDINKQNPLIPSVGGNKRTFVPPNDRTKILLVGFGPEQCYEITGFKTTKAHIEKDELDETGLNDTAKRASPVILTDYDAALGATAEFSDLNFHEGTDRDWLGIELPEFNKLKPAHEYPQETPDLEDSFQIVIEHYSLNQSGLQQECIEKEPFSTMSAVPPTPFSQAKFYPGAIKDEGRLGDWDIDYTPGYLEVAIDPDRRQNRAPISIEIFGGQLPGYYVPWLSNAGDLGYRIDCPRWGGAYEDTEFLALVEPRNGDRNFYNLTVTYKAWSAKFRYTDPETRARQVAFLEFMWALAILPPELNMFIEPGSGFIDPNKMGCEVVDCPPAHEAFKLAVIGQYYSALQLFETAAGRNPTNAGLFYNLGVTNMLLGNHGAASRDFSEAIDLNEQIAGVAYALRSVNYAKMGETFLAMQDVQQAARSGVDQESLMTLIDDMLGQR